MTATISPAMSCVAITVPYLNFTLEAKMKGIGNRILLALAASIVLSKNAQASTLSARDATAVVPAVSLGRSARVLPAMYARSRPSARPVRTVRRMDCATLVADMEAINASTGRLLGSLGQVQTMMQQPLTNEELESLRQLEGEINTQIGENNQTFDELFDTWWANC